MDLKMETKEIVVKHLQKEFPGDRIWEKKGE